MAPALLLRRPMRALGFLAVLGGVAGCAAVPPSACETDNGGCGKRAVCSTATSKVTCVCETGFVRSGASCLPRVTVRVNGTPVDLADVPYEVAVLEVPDSTTTLDLDVSVQPSSFVKIDGANAKSKSVPRTDRVMRFEISIEDGQSLISRQVMLAVQPKGELTPIAAFQISERAISVALSADGKVVATGSLLSLNEGVVTTHETGGLEWADAGVLRGKEHLGWSVALSNDGTLLTNTGDQTPLIIWKKNGGGWVEELISDPVKGQSAVVSRDGQRIWVAGKTTCVGLVQDGGTWGIETRLDASGEAIAVSNDNNRVVVGSQASNAVKVFGRTAQGFVLEQSLVRDGGFGAGVALSADGSALIISAALVPQRAEIFEHSDAGFVKQAEVLPALFPKRGVSALVSPGVPVALSDDGQTASVGFGNDGNVVIATRARGVWQVREVLLPPKAESGALFGLGVGLSADGKRVAVACPNCVSRTTVYGR